MNEKILKMPLSKEEIASLKSGDKVLLSGEIYTARDAAHKRLKEAIENGDKLPFDLENQGIYYVGACPAKPNQVVGSAGPTTSMRMDFATPLLLSKGIKVLIGKGKRSEDVRKAIAKNNAVYFAAVGGAGSLIAKKIVKSKLIAYEELLSEAIYKYTFDKMPLIVAIDSFGNSIYDR